jgi:signal transduction histidine kinase
VTVEQHVPPIAIHADREGLTLVLRNLLENAVKFSRKEIEARIELGAREEGARVLLWVRDNGIGFDMKYHDRIFDIFQRLHRAENYPGTGIGLALVKKAVQRMGGRVWAESTPGNGATFYLDLPR